MLSTPVGKSWLNCQCMLYGAGFEHLHSFAFLGDSGRIGTASDGLFSYVPAGPNKQLDMFLHAYDLRKQGRLQVIAGPPRVLTGRVFPQKGDECGELCIISACTPRTAQVECRDPQRQAIKEIAFGFAFFHSLLPCWCAVNRQATLFFPKTVLV